jgi:hypothetical protein
MLIPTFSTLFPVFFFYFYFPSAGLSSAGTACFERSPPKSSEAMQQGNMKKKKKNKSAPAQSLYSVSLISPFRSHPAVSADRDSSPAPPADTGFLLFWDIYLYARVCLLVGVGFFFLLSPFHSCLLLFIPVYQIFEAFKCVFYFFALSVSLF